MLMTPQAIVRKLFGYIKRNIAFIGILFLLWFLLTSCKTKTVYVPVKETEIIIENEIDTIVEIRLVPEKEKAEVQPSDTSKIENSYAYSWAFFDGNLLHHFLGIKDIGIPVKIKYKDRLIYKTVPVPYPVEEKPPWYKEFFYYSGIIAWIIILLLTICFLGLKIAKRKSF